MFLISFLWVHSSFNPIRLQSRHTLHPNMTMVDKCVWMQFMVRWTSCAKCQQQTSHWSIQKGLCLLFSRFCSGSLVNKCLTTSVFAFSSLSRPSALNHFHLSMRYSRHPFIDTTRTLSPIYGPLWSAEPWSAKVIWRCSLKDSDSYLRSLHRFSSKIYFLRSSVPTCVVATVLIQDIYKLASWNMMFI